jgi:hypothetical protein
MTSMCQKSLSLIAAVAIGAGGLLWDGDFRFDRSESFVSKAEAVRGRPLTPMSYAGVARRTTRRAVAVGAATAPVVVAPAPGCVQVINSYGHVTYHCP